MVPPQDLRRTYYHIIDDVVAKMKPEFVQESVDETVLHTIRQRWAQKLTERGIITEGDGQDDGGAVKKEDDNAGVHGSSGANPRKRPLDGAGPTTKQEVFDPPLTAAAQAGPNALPQQLQQQQLLQQQQFHQQQQAQRLGQQQQIPVAGMVQHQLQHAGMQGLPANVQQQLQQQLQQARAQAQGMTAAGVQGLPAGVHGLPPGIHAAMAAAAGAQGIQPGVQGMARIAHVPAGMQAIPGMPGVPMMQSIPHLQQHLASAATGQHMARLPQGMPAMMHAQQQQQQQRQQASLHQGYTIPQSDGSADLPAAAGLTAATTPSTLDSMAAAAGMSSDSLRALLPPQFMAAMAAAKARSSGSSSGSSLQATALVGAGSSSGAQVAAAAAATAGKGLQSKRSKQQQRRRRRRGCIPQVDGNGDDDGDGYDEEDEGEEEDDGEAAGEEEEQEQQDEDEDDDADDEEIAKMDDDLDALEQADKEEIENVGFALYEKVHRAKNRWRCNLRYGVFFINGKEYMFNKGTTDLTF